MNPYSKLMYDSIHNLVSVEDKKKLLKNVETELIKIVGVEKPYWLQRFGEDDDNRILSLIESRSKILDDMFLATPAACRDGAFRTSEQTLVGSDKQNVSPHCRDVQMLAKG